VRLPEGGTVLESTACVRNNLYEGVIEVAVDQQDNEEHRAGLDGQARRLGALLCILAAVMFYGSILLLVRSFS
jgi:hypothetical protein